jgi:histidyl-tRNA synthetase
LILGAKIAQSATLEEWKDQPAQVEVPREYLVERVKAMLDDQKDMPKAKPLSEWL